MLKILIPILISISISCCSSHQAPAVSTEDNVSLDVQNILWWFPEDTETVTVARGPFKAEALDKNSWPIDLEKALCQISIAEFIYLNDSKFSKYVNGQTVLLSVEGSRKFRAPTALGGMPYEGCSVICFDAAGFVSQTKLLLQSLQAAARQTRNINGHRVFVFNEKREGDVWEIFLTFPRESIVMCATNEKFLSEMFSRLDKVDGRRALPQSLPEWESIDVQAPFWGIRHYAQSSYDQDPSSPLSGETRGFNIPDKQGIGLTYVYDPRRANELRIKYLSENKDADRLADEYWNAPEGEDKPQVRKGTSGVDIVFVFQNNRDPLLALFLLRGALGQGV